jgi:hypothetical protein
LNGAQIFNASIIKRQNIVKDDIFSITLQAETPTIGVQNQYNDLDMIGRHYLVYHKNYPHKKR